MCFVPADSMIVAIRRGYRLLMAGLARSAWDSATPKEPSRRVRYDSYRCLHRFDRLERGISNAVSLSRINWNGRWRIQRRYKPFKKSTLAFLKKHGALFDQKYLWDHLRPIRPYPMGRFFRGCAVPGTSCLATISLSLRDKSHSPIEGPRIKLALMGSTLG